MEMVTVTARQAFPYAGVNRRVGESFQAAVEDAVILTLVGRVDVIASPTPVADAEIEKVAQKRAPRRRDPSADLTE